MEILGAVLLGIFLSALDQTIVGTALPRIVTDIDAERVRRAVDEFRATAVAPDEIYGVAADIFAPCALGGVINDKTLPQLKVEIVSGAANGIGKAISQRFAAEGAWVLVTDIDRSGGERTVEEIRLQTHASEFHVCRVFYRQWQEGRLKVVRPRLREATGLTVAPAPWERKAKVSA